MFALNMEIMLQSRYIDVYQSDVHLYVHHFFIRYHYLWKLHYSYVALCFANLLYLFRRQNYIINAFLTMTYISWP